MSPYIPLAMMAVVLGVILFRTWGPWARAYDLRVLWPSFKRHASSLEIAREGFVVHMGIDPNWRALCDDWTDEQFIAWVEKHLR